MNFENIQDIYSLLYKCFLFDKQVIYLNTVEPIRDIDIVNDIMDYLKADNERDYVLFSFGIYSGLRISDILKLRVRDIRNKKHIYMREKKTGKERRFIISKELKNIFDSYIKDKKDYEYLFVSRKGLNKPITRQRAYMILKDVGKRFGIESIGTHSLRKTFGYFLYKQTKDILVVKEVLGHTDVSITRRYIGLTQDDKDKLMKGLSYGRS